MEENQIKPFYKRKAVGIPAVLILTAAFAMAAYQVFSFEVENTGLENLDTTTFTFSGTGFACDTIQHNFSLDNLANNPVNVTLEWTELENLDGVNYTHNFPIETTLPGDSTDNIISGEYTLDCSSAPGSWTGNVTVDRHNPA